MRSTSTELRTCPLATSQASLDDLAQSPSRPADAKQTDQSVRCATVPGQGTTAALIWASDKPKRLKSTNTLNFACWSVSIRAPKLLQEASDHQILGSSVLHNPTLTNRRVQVQTLFPSHDTPHSFSDSSQLRLHTQCAHSGRYACYTKAQTQGSAQLSGSKS